MKSRKKAIRDHCLICAGGSAKEVTLCCVIDCPLWEWRFGDHSDTPVSKKRFIDMVKRENMEGHYTDIGLDLSSYSIRDNRP